MVADAKPKQGNDNPRTNKLARKVTRERFLRIRNAGKTYETQLRAVARQIGELVRGFAPKGVVSSPSALSEALQRYAAAIRPWARNISERMIAEVNQRDEKAWTSLGREIGRELRKEVRSATLKPFRQDLLREQTELITSLPIKAAQRVNKLSTEAVMNGTRSKEIANEIMRTTEVTKSRATLIARTEVARTASALTMARAETLGSVGYIWRTSKDSDVRHLHKKLEGTYHRYDDPPVAGENGERAHAGMIYNCRCWMEPVLPD